MSSLPNPAVIRVSADPESVRVLAGFLRDQCIANDIGEPEVFDLELAVVEAANNIVEHGYREMPDGVIELRFEIVSGDTHLTISDWGTPAPDGTFLQCRDVPADAVEGRGIHIVRSCVDVIHYTREGNENRLHLIKLASHPN